MSDEVMKKKQPEEDGHEYLTELVLELDYTDRLLTLTCPVLALRNCEVLPGYRRREYLLIGRAKSRRAVAEAICRENFIFFATQTNAADDDPAGHALHVLGTVGRVTEIEVNPDGSLGVTVEGLYRAKIIKFTDRADYLEAEVGPLGSSAATADVPVEMEKGQ
jgi:ATP-dependent Lon protease